MQIYRNQFPALYRATDWGELKTSTGSAIQLRGETLITYPSAIQRTYGKAFRYLDASTQRDIESAVEANSNTAEKRIRCWNGRGVINNHQPGNMMPFPSGTPSLNCLRADRLRIPAGQAYDYYRTLGQQLNPDVRMNADLKHAIGSKVPARTKAKLHAAATDHMARIEADPGRVKSYFQDPRVKYAA